MVGTLLIQRQLSHPPDVVWAALTDPSMLGEWLAASSVDLALGGRIELAWHEVGGGISVTRGVITRLEAPSLVEYWTEDCGTLRWDLRPDGDGGCILTFTNELPRGAALAPAG